MAKAELYTTDYLHQYSYNVDGIEVHRETIRNVRLLYIPNHGSFKFCDGMFGREISQFDRRDSLIADLKKANNLNLVEICEVPDGLVEKLVSSSSNSDNQAEYESNAREITYSLPKH